VCRDDGKRNILGRRAQRPSAQIPIDEAVWRTRLVKNHQSGQIWLETKGHLANAGLNNEFSQPALCKREIGMTGLGAFTRRQILRLVYAMGFFSAGLRQGMGKGAPSAAGGGQSSSSECSLYPEIDELDCRLFALQGERMGEAQRRHALQAMKQYLTRQKGAFLGFQVNQSLSYARDLSFLLDMHANNIGDPFENSNMTLNTKAMERAVLDYFAALWRAAPPGASNADIASSYWGYVLSMGSTEGNLFGLYTARDYLAGRGLFREPGGQIACKAARAPQGQPNAYRPVAFFSEDTHYSIVKALRTLAIDSFHELGESRYPGQCPFNGGRWPLTAPSQGGDRGPGAIDIEKLGALVAFFAEKGHPIIVVLNYGTTFKGAYDDAGAVGDALEPILKKHGLIERQVQYDSGRCDLRRGYWIHVDAALGGAYMPFLKMAKAKGLIGDAGPDFDFALPHVHSITMSGHKWLGAPVPCGVYMMRRKDQLMPPDDPEYIGAHDTTFAGSRSALAPAILWSCLARASHEDLMHKAIRNEDIATYAFERLSALDRQMGGRLWVERTPLSLAVRFRAPSEAIVRHHSLSVTTLTVDGEKRTYAHVYVMDHVTKALIDRLAEEVAQDRAYQGK
jgi:histidine decarboxylase